MAGWQKEGKTHAVVRLAPHARRVSRAAVQIGRFLLLLHKDVRGRYWEIDALRGIAILTMITYHVVYDLVMFGHSRADLHEGAWFILARLTAAMFILLMGASLVLGRSPTGMSASGRRGFVPYLVRGLKLIGWGLVATLATWLYMGRVVVLFGILHLMGAVTVLAYPLLPFRWLNLVIGSGVIALSVLVGESVPPHPARPALRVLGLQGPAFHEIDYFPLLPWFGVAALGMFVAHLVYPDGRRRFSLPDLGRRPGPRHVAWLGRHSLLIYLIHQPILIAGLTLVGAVG